MKKTNVIKCIKKAMKYRDVSQAELAKLSGLTEAAISQILNNKRDPKFSSVLYIFSALKMDIGFKGFQDEMSGVAI